MYESKKHFQKSKKNGKTCKIILNIVDGATIKNNGGKNRQKQDNKKITKIGEE